MPDRNATVEIARSEHGLQFRLVDDGGKYPDGPDFVSFKPTKAGLPPLSSRTNVEKYARAITRALSRHEAVQKELEQIFYTTSPDRASLEFVIATPEGERYRWETLLSEPNRFLALSGLCSMKRIAGTSSAAPGLRIFAWPIQVTAFLSASGVSAAKEFRAVTDGVCAARAQGLDIEATIYMGEEDLLAEARGAIRRRKLPGVHLAPIPDSAIGIEKVLKSKPPQILHCFCHGYAEAGVELLEFASINDHDTDARVGSINFSADRLIEALRAGDATWLTVLNSCSGAAAMPQVFSMAAGLAKSSSPVAIGMAEPLRSDDANLFASAFYRSAMQILADNLRSLQVGDTTRIDLAPAVDEARKVLYDQGDLIPDAGDFGRWSLPVLYQRRGPLKIGCAADDAMCERIFMVARALRGFTARTPPEVRATMLALLDKPPPVPPALRPDQFGEFP
jgi:hypothetical protein